MNNKVLRRTTIHYRIRKKIAGTAVKPRLTVFRSNAGIYAQIIDDLAGHTIAAASSKEIKTGGNKSEVAKQVGILVANKVKAKGIETVVFDRGGFLYHGRVKSLADGAREGGLTF
jgi:large subunit ribosomal protein L18